MKRVLLLVLFLYSIIVDFAQINTGINTSTWGGVSNVNWNPAIADGKYKADVSLGTINSGFAQNHRSLKYPEAVFYNTDFNALFSNGNAVSSYLWSDSVISFLLSSVHAKTINQWTQVEGPGSFMFPFGKNKNAFALSWHYNNARTIYSVPFNGGSASDATLNITKAQWMDIGITYSRVVLDKDEHFVKAGVTVKPLVGFDISTFSATNSSYAITGNDVSFSSGIFNASHSTNVSGGMAADVGFVYEWRPDKDKYRYDIDTFTGILPRYKNLYKLAFGFSIIDMGALLPSSANVSLNQTSTSGFNIFHPNDLSSGSLGSATVLLPTRFNMYLDYNIGKGFGLNLNASVSEYFSKSNSQIAHGSYISLVPRFDMPMIGIYLPFSYNFTSGQPNLGVSLRAGPVWFGISDFVGMASGDIRGAAFFGGVKIPIFYRSPKDKDKDKVSNRYDLCRDEIGTWASKGCLDADGDGIRDFEDACPQDAGLPQFNGCPDRDGDGVMDKNDLCPDIPGLVSMNGCGDKDGDGVPDKEDLCPDEAGPIEFKGCPDGDGDGVPDNEDRCKDKKGSALHKGCPDTDGDGVYDYEDDNELEAGPVENHGAPWADSDGDGVMDNEDSCKIVPGLPEYHGCPTPARPRLVKELTHVYDTLLFESNFFDISSRNESMLRVFAQIMQKEEHKYENIVLIGHTDNVEWNDATREALSLKRATAAKNELIDLGINAKRIEVFPAGDEEPVGDNTKVAGRKKNRSVIIYSKIIPN